MLKNIFKSGDAKLMHKVVKKLTARGHTGLRAELPGFKKPGTFTRKSENLSFVPDITSLKGEQFCLFSIESGKSLADKSRHDRWKMFEDYSLRNNALFYIVCAKDLVEPVKKLLAEENIQAHLWDLSEKK